MAYNNKKTDNYRQKQNIHKIWQDKCVSAQKHKLFNKNSEHIRIRLFQLCKFYRPGLFQIGLVNGVIIRHETKMNSKIVQLFLKTIENT